VNDTSNEDFSFSFKLMQKYLICAVMEAKGAEDSSLVALRHASCYATNMVLGMMAKGVPRDLVMCFVIGSNGLEIWFD
jgi:hypothetical protein